MARIYLASSWRNPFQQDTVEILRSDGHEVYDFQKPGNDRGAFSWAKCDPDWESWTPDEFIEVMKHSTIAAGGWTSDYRAMRWCDTGILLMPAGNSAHVEIGQLMEMRKRTIIILSGKDFKPDLMYLGADHIVRSLTEARNILGIGSGKVRNL